MKQPKPEPSTDPQPKFDDVLRRMLSSPPKQHKKPSKDAAKSKPKAP